MVDSYIKEDNFYLEWWFQGIPLPGSVFPIIIRKTSGIATLVLKNVGDSPANLTALGYTGSRTIEYVDQELENAWSIDIIINPSSNIIPANSQVNVNIIYNWTYLSNANTLTRELLEIESVVGLRFFISNPLLADDPDNFDEGFTDSTNFSIPIYIEDINPTTLSASSLKTAAVLSKQDSYDLLTLNPGDLYYGVVRVTNGKQGATPPAWSDYTEMFSSVASDICTVTFVDEDLLPFSLPEEIPFGESIVFGYKLEMHKAVYGLEMTLGIAEVTVLDSIFYPKNLQIFSNLITEINVDGWYENGNALGASFPDMHSSHRIEFRGTFIYDFNFGDEASYDPEDAVTSNALYVPQIYLDLMSRVIYNDVHLKPWAYRDGEEDLADWLQRAALYDDVFDEPLQTVTTTVPVGPDSICWISADGNSWILYVPATISQNSFSDSAYRNLFEFAHENSAFPTTLPASKCFISDDGWHLNGWDGERISDPPGGPADKMVLENLEDDFIFEPGVTYYFRLTPGALKRTDFTFYNEEYAVPLPAPLSPPLTPILGDGISIDSRVSYPINRTSNFLTVRPGIGVKSVKYTGNFNRVSDTVDIQRPWLEFVIPNEDELIHKIGNGEIGDAIDITFAIRNTGSAPATVYLNFTETLNYSGLIDEYKIYQNFSNIPIPPSESEFPITVIHTLNSNDLIGFETTWLRLQDISSWDYETGRDYYNPYIEPTYNFLAYLASMDFRHDNHAPDTYDELAYPAFGGLVSSHSYVTTLRGLNSTYIDAFGNEYENTLSPRGAYNPFYNNMDISRKTLKILNSLSGWIIGSIFVQ